jgi:hypothetical protein
MIVREAAQGCSISGSFGSLWVTARTITCRQKENPPKPFFMVDGNLALTFDLAGNLLTEVWSIAQPKQVIY